MSLVCECYAFGSLGSCAFPTSMSFEMGGGGGEFSHLSNISFLSLWHSMVSTLIQFCQNGSSVSGCCHSLSWLPRVVAFARSAMTIASKVTETKVSGTDWESLSHRLAHLFFRRAVASGPRYFCSALPADIKFCNNVQSSI